MTFAGMTLAGLLPLAIGGAVAITGLYLLRMRRRQVVVPFAALWEIVTRESESRKLWRRLRRMLSWLVQILILLLILAALGDPRPDVWLREPQTLAIVIDRSASMSGTTEDGGTRLDAARVRAQQEIAALGPADQAVIISAGEEVGVVAPRSGDQTALAAALATIEPSYGEADLGRALALAEHVVADSDGPRVLVLTDGALDDASLLALSRCTAGAVPCAIATTSGATDNVAITAFAARRYPNARDKVEVLAEVKNLGDTPAVVELDVQADGVSVGRRRLELLPGQSRREALADLEAARARFVAHLESVDDAPAGMSTALGPAFDDIAYAVVPPLSPLAVAVVTDGTDLFLEAALLTQGEHVELTGVSPDQAVAGHAALRDADVVVFDVGDGPLPQTLPDAHLLVFDPLRRLPSPFPIAKRTDIKRPFLTEQLRDHPVLAHVVLKDVNISRGTTFALEPGDQALVRTLGEPIVMLRERGDHGLVAVGFDPRQTDLPLRVAFPLFIDNVLRYFEQREPGFVASIALGGSRELALAELGMATEGVTRVKVRAPDGTVREQPVEDGRIRLRALEPGFFEFEATEGEAESTAELAVNQTGTAASDLHSRTDDLEDSVRAGEPPTPAPVAQGPLWTAIILLAAAIVIVEWATYHRRITV
jgi:hypothetical protein